MNVTETLENGILSDNNSITFDATLDNVSLAIDFVNEKAVHLPFTAKERIQIEIAVDEIVSNIARYAYNDKTGMVTVKTEADETGFTITVIDSGIPYNPLEKSDPDITLSAEERGIGGYGIFIVKKIMDEVSYEYTDGKNILKMRKNFIKRQEILPADNM